MIDLADQDIGDSAVRAGKAEQWDSVVDFQVSATAHAISSSTSSDTASTAAHATVSTAAFAIEVRHDKI